MSHTHTAACPSPFQPPTNPTSRRPSSEHNMPPAQLPDSPLTPWFLPKLPAHTSLVAAHLLTHIAACPHVTLSNTFTHPHSCLAISWNAALSSRCSSPLIRTTPTSLSPSPAPAAAPAAAADDDDPAADDEPAAASPGADLPAVVLLLVLLLVLCFVASVCRARSTACRSTTRVQQHATVKGCAQGMAACV